MESDRREHPRAAKRFDGGWQGASGRGACTVNDLSLGGCYVQTMAVPQTGEATVVTVRFGSHDISLHGIVVYVEAGMGFAVRFDDLSDDDRDQLREIMTSPAATAVKTTSGVISK